MAVNGNGSCNTWAAAWQNLHKDMCTQRRQNSLGIRPVWSESSLCGLWVAKDRRYLHADSEGSDQTGRMPRLIRVLAGRTCHFVGFVMMRIKWLFSHHRLRVLEDLIPWTWNEPRHDKTNKMSMRPAKTQISPVWSESSLSTWRKLGSLATHWAHSEDSDQTGSKSSLGAQSLCWFCHVPAQMKKERII